MTKEELDDYIANNEPIEIKLDEIGRWTERIFEKAIERYNYFCTPGQVLADPLKYRDSYRVKEVIREEVANGN